MKHNNSSQEEKRMSSHNHNHQHSHNHGHGHGRGSRQDQNKELKDTALQLQPAVSSNDHVAPSPIVEETDQEIAEIQESERLFIARHSTSSSKSRPASVRPGSTRSTFENLPGTRPPSRKAMFSLSACYNGVIEFRQPSLNMYAEESRNLIRLNKKDPSRKNKLLKYGRLPVISQLCLLPKTTHDSNSFVVDVGFVSASLLSFTVCGIFKEGESKADRPLIRWFTRSFLTVPYGQGMIITNDMLTVANASPEQVQKSFKHPAPTPSSSPVPEMSPATNPFETQTGLNQEEKQKITLSFVNDSGMNAEWSAKCLEENDWNYQKAGLVFLELKKQNKIPAEAFLK